jgi:hypothetical protein
MLDLAMTAFFNQSRRYISTKNEYKMNMSCNHWNSADHGRQICIDESDVHAN